MRLFNTVLLCSLLLALPQSGQAQSKMKSKGKAKSMQTTITNAVSATAAGQTKASVVGPRRPMQNASLSEYAFQPAPGFHSLSVQTVYVSRNADVRYKKESLFDSKNYTNTKGFLLMTRYNRGLDNGWGVAAEVGTTVGPMDVEQQDEKAGRSKGLTDFAFTARNHKDVKAGEMIYGGQFNFSPTERETATNRDDGNLYSGGHSLAGFVGLQKERNNLVWGGQLKHQMYLERSSVLKSSTSKTKLNLTAANGNQFAAEGFVEMPRNHQLYGAKMEWVHTLPTDYTLKAQGGDKISLATDAYNTMKLAAYGNFAVKSMNNLEVIPEISYFKVLGDSGGSIIVRDSSAETLLSLSARLSL